MDNNDNNLLLDKNRLDIIINNTNKIIPLQYNNILINNDIENIILIHDEIKDYNNFVINSNKITFPIVYNNGSSKNDLLYLLKIHFFKIKRIAFVFHNTIFNNLKPFLDNDDLFTYDDLKDNTLHYSSNLSFIINLVREFNIMHLDYLACNTLNYEHWNKYYNIIEKNTNVIIGASNDETGNLEYGGNWLLENTNEDIKNIYFTNDIESYQYLLLTNTITASPSSIVTSGTTIIFTSTVTNGSGTYTYQWENNNNIIPGINSSTYELTTSISNNNDIITCVVTESDGSTITSNSIQITVNQPLTNVITASPSSTVTSGTTITFTSTVTNGSGTYSYQWKNNDNIIPDINSSTYALTVSNANNNNIITCVVTNSSGTIVTSNNITLTITPIPPNITTQPVNILTNKGDNAVFTVTATGDTPFTYEWYKNSTLIENSNNSSLILTNIDYVNEGTYYVKIKSSYNVTVDSNDVTLIVKPTILSISSGNVYIKTINNTIQYATSANNIYYNIYWPFKIINTNPISSNIINVIFVNNIEITNNKNSYIDNNMFFIVGSQYINFNGYYNQTFQTITMKLNYNYDYYDNYKGLIQNGSGTISINEVKDGNITYETLTSSIITNGYSNINLMNISIIIYGDIKNNIQTSIGIYNGWLCQSFFGYNATNNNISNCKSINSGDNFNNNSKWNGGIAGSFSNFNKIENCNSTCKINVYSGGILGSYSKCITINNCYSTGNIDSFAGGIVGNFHQSSITITNCFSTGYFIYKSAGGIIGSDVSYNIANTININNCYSLSNSINGQFDYSTSIIGGSIYYNIYNNNISKYTNMSSNKPTININNCYSIRIYYYNEDPDITNYISLTIYSPSNSNDRYININITNSYNTNGNNWNNTNANSALITTPSTDNKWISTTTTTTNIPYMLKSFENTTPVYIFDTYKYDYVIVGNNINLEVKYIGSSPITFAWYFNDIIISGSNSSIYQITNAIQSQQGKYTCKIYNDINYTTYSIYLNVVNTTCTIIENISTNGIIKIKTNSNNIEYELMNSSSYTTITKWPVFIISKPSNYTGLRLGIYLESDITITDINQYFILGSESISFNGENNNIIINSLSYNGLIQNGTSTLNGYEDIFIYELNINKGTNNTILNDYGGYLCQAYFCKNANKSVSLTKCTCNMDVNGNYSGGLIGAYSRLERIKECILNGNVNGNYAGGLIGAYYSNKTLDITDPVYSYIFRCYINGNINGNYSGGIVGAYSTLNSLTESFNNGNINGLNSGGLIGSDIGYNNNNNDSISISTCYTLGNISSTSGGLIGGLYSSNTKKIKIYIDNCYTFGKYTNNNGLIAESIKNNIQLNVNNTYISNNNWSNITANTIFNNISNTWITYTNDIPYTLKYFNGSVSIYDEKSLKTPVKITNTSPNSTKVVGESITMYVYANGTPTINYQWQFSSDNGITYTNIGSISTNNNYTISQVNYSNNGLYRCIASNNVSIDVAYQTIIIDTSIPILLSVLFQDAPTIEKISPLYGDSQNSQLITISGTNFNSLTMVNINNTSIKPTFNNSTSLEFRTPILVANIYNISVTNTNTNLTSIITANSIYTVLTIPSIPNNVVAIANNRSANISWDALTNNNILYYTVYCSDTNINSINVKTANVLFTGLANDITYTFTVTATNNIGTGNKSTNSNSIIPRHNPSITSVKITSSGLDYCIIDSTPINITIIGNNFYTPTITIKSTDNLVNLVITDIIITKTLITCNISRNYNGVFITNISDIGGNVSYNNMFTIYQLPTITNITPNIGSSIGGTLITITGSNLIYITSITFGGFTINNYNTNSTTLSFKTIPKTSISTSTNNPLIEINCLGTSISTNLFNYLGPPTVTSTETSSSANTLKIIGTNLINALIYIGLNSVNSTNIVYDANGLYLNINNYSNPSNYIIKVETIGGSVSFTNTNINGTSNYTIPIVTSVNTSS